MSTNRRQAGTPTQFAYRPVARFARGFTLIELMMVIAVVAILATLAFPSYQQYVLRTGRAEAKALLMQTAQSLERCYTRDSAYDGDNCALDESTTTLSENDKYELSISNLGQSTFTLTATPQGAQTKDTKCGNLTLDHRGQRGISGSGTVEECWGS